MKKISSPPFVLKQTNQDLRDLIRHFLGTGTAVGRRLTGLDPAAEELLLAYAWPGNVRELENVINRASILADGERITLADIPAELSARAGGGGTAVASGSSGDLRGELRRFEAEIVYRTLAGFSGDRRQAAQRLGIGLSSLDRKLEEFEREGLGRETEPRANSNP